jgi:TRAP-type C4-dicarboxylate transport system substrate-binding protein
MRLAYVVAVSALALFGAMRDASAQIKLRVADSFPITHPNVEVARFWNKRVEELTQGKVKIDYFPAEQLAKSADLLDAAINRIADITYVGPLYISDRVPLATVAAIPMVGNVTDPEALSMAYHKIARAEITEHEMLPQGVRVVRATATFPYQMITTKKQVNRMEDLQGLKIRSSGGIQEKSIEALGAVPVSIPAPDLYPAVQRGTVDGMVFNLPTVPGYKLQELVKFTTTNVNLGMFPITYVINESRWKSLPEDVQQAMLQAGDEAVAFESAIYRKREEALFKEFERRRVTAYELSSAEIARWSKKLDPIKQAWVADLEKSGKPASKVLARWEVLVTK